MSMLVKPPRILTCHSETPGPIGPSGRHRSIRSTGPLNCFKINSGAEHSNICFLMQERLLDPGHGLSRADLKTKLSAGQSHGLSLRKDIVHVDLSVLAPSLFSN